MTAHCRGLRVVGERDSLIRRSRVLSAIQVPMRGKAASSTLTKFITCPHDAGPECLTSTPLKSGSARIRLWDNSRRTHRSATQRIVMAGCAFEGHGAVQPQVL